MTSAAFPQKNEDIFAAAGQPIAVVARGTIIPGSYVKHPHENPGEVTVKQGGLPILGVDGQPFTVADVAPERRWAIGYDGEVLPEHFMPAKLEEIRVELYQLLRSQGREARYEGSHAREYVPSVKKYVSQGVDPDDDSQLRAIGFDPSRKAGAKPEHFYDAEGEKIKESRVAILAKSYHDPDLRKALTGAEIAEVEAELGVSGADSNEIASRLELLAEMRANDEITEAVFLDKIRKLSGAPAPDVEQAVEASDSLVAPCGFHSKSNAGLAAHIRNCQRPGCAEDPPEDSS